MEVSLWDDLVFFWEIVKRTYTKRKKSQSFIAKYKDKILILHSHKEIDTYLEQLKS